MPADPRWGEHNAEHDHDVDLDRDLDLPTQERLGRIALALSDDDRTLLQPPPGIWAAIERAIDLDSSAGVERRAVPARFVPRGRRWTAAAGAVAVAATALVAVMVVDGSDPADETVVATARLNALTGVGGASASLTDEEGVAHLHLQTEGLPAPTGFYEVWLLASDAQSLVSLGPLRQDGDYVIPQGIDPEAYPIVDVSHEPLDGDPTHSADSLLRGDFKRVDPAD